MGGCDFFLILHGTNFLMQVNNTPVADIIMGKVNYNELLKGQSLNFKVTNQGEEREVNWAQ